MLATTHLDLRIEDEAERAFALLGLKNLTEYVVKLMNKNAWFMPMKTINQLLSA